MISSVMMAFFFNYLIIIFENKLAYEENFKSAYIIGVVLMSIFFYLIIAIAIKAFKISDIKLKY